MKKKCILSLIIIFALALTSFAAFAANEDTKTKSTIEIVAEITDEITGEKIPVETEIIECAIKPVPSREPSDRQ
ncbi:MAG: hypothetical protein IKD83_01145 [Firmicutes bacterium]|nr:hypothetical protein [Bacillota bacterium]